MKKLLIVLAVTVGLTATAFAQAVTPVFMTAYFVCRAPDLIITLLNQPEAEFAETANELLVMGQCAARSTGYSIVLVSKWTEVTSPRDGVVYEVWEVMNNKGAIAYSFVKKLVTPFIGV